MVESTALEMRHTRKGIGGSNPSLSARTVSGAVRRRPRDPAKTLEQWSFLPYFCPRPIVPSHGLSLS